MSNTNYQAMSDKELVDCLEKGEMHKNPDLYAEFMRRMEEIGTFYSNTPDEEDRWRIDIGLSAQRESKQS